MRNTHTHDSVNMDRSVANNLSQAGLVLDELGPAHLREVRDGAASLNAKYEQARRQKDERKQASFTTTWPLHTFNGCVPTFVNDPINNLINQ